MRRRTFLPSVLLLAALAAGTSPSSGLSFPVDPLGPVLLRVDIHTTGGGVETASEVLIFRDGLTLSRSRGNDNCTSRGQADAAAINRLKQALTELEIGKQAGGCQFYVDLFIDSGEMRFMWYGRRRTHTFRIGTDPARFPHETCPDNSVKVAEALQDFFGAVSARRNTVTGCFDTPIDPQTVCK